MRLLELRDGTISLTEHLPDSVPRYAILSHTWGSPTDEVSFSDLMNGSGKNKPGYDKIRFCAEQAKRDCLCYFWIDTCCIDKTNNNELSSAIISMFRWYQNADRCYVYLPDVTIAEHQDVQFEPAWDAEFRSSHWFTRGWTLQELLAPKSVEFFTKDGYRLGDKTSLQQQIHEVTGISTLALQEGDLSGSSNEERFRWVEMRRTTLEEDLVYCLLNIFDVSMPVLYGEGKSKALRRLKQEIAAESNDSVHSSKAKKRVWTVAFERNLAFTSREREIKRIREKLSVKQRTARVAITGLGGVGKTQLALEFVYQRQQEYPDCDVFWIPAVSSEGIEQAYRAATKGLGLPGCDDAKIDVKKLLQEYLSSDKGGRWLVVFDNVDDIHLWEDTPNSKGLLDYLPKSEHGSIIFTTRNRQVALSLARQNVISLSEMDETSGQELLRNYLFNPDLLNSKEDTLALLTQLTFLPLAIVQSAAYINKNDIDFQEYMLLLKEQEKNVIALLSEDFEDESRYNNVKNPVATTWLISFEQIRKRDPLAADYLSFMACVDVKDIPRSLLPPGPSRKEETDAIGTLQAYSFINKQSNTVINMHRLVHIATRNWLRMKEQLHCWTGKAIERLAHVLKNAEQHNRTEWQPIMPHAYYTLSLSDGCQDNDDQLCLQACYGICLYFSGRYQEAEKLFQRVAKVRKIVLGEEHPDTLDSMGNLSSTYRHQGRLEEAESLEVLVLEARKRVLGEEHPDTLASMNNLASTYRHQGRWEEAESLEVLVLEARTT